MPGTVFSKWLYCASSLMSNTITVSYKGGFKVFKERYYLFMNILNKFLTQVLLKKQWQVKVTNWVSRKENEWLGILQEGIALPTSDTEMHPSSETLPSLVTVPDSAVFMELIFISDGDITILYFFYLQGFSLSSSHYSLTLDMAVS